MRQGFFQVSDGTRLRYQITGEGPAVVLVNGLGGSFPAWKPIVNALSGEYTFYCYDYRGLFGSERPSDLSRLTVGDHADDLRCLLDHFDIRQAVFIGWSFGGQVLMEAYNAFPERFSGLVLLNALVGPATDGLPLREILHPLFRWMTGLWRPAWHLLAPLASRAVSSKAFVLGAKHAGLISKTLDEEVFEEIAREFISMDHEVFQRILVASQEYDGSPVLSTLALPVLVLSGSRDFIVLPSLTRTIAAAIPDARLVMLPGTSHYSALEDPETVVAEIAAYLHNPRSLQ